METRKVKFKSIDDGKEIYIDLPVATDEAREYYKRNNIISILNTLRLMNYITTQQFRSERGKIIKSSYHINEAIRFINRFNTLEFVKFAIDHINDFNNKEFVKLSHNNYMEIVNDKTEENND